MAGRRVAPHLTRLMSGLLASVALLVAVIGVAALAFVLPPIDAGSANPRTAVTLGVFLVTAVVVTVLGLRARRALLKSERLTQEQSALRRVATLVAGLAPASVVFEAVTQEVGLLCGADLARMERFEEDGSVSGVAAWARVPGQLAVGTRFQLDGLSVARDVRRSAVPVRVESFSGAEGEIAREALELGIRSSVGCPIVVAGHLWGVIAASTMRDEPFPVDTESQIGRFTELIATAIANAQARLELRVFAEEQAALRRVATLVATGGAAEEVFAAVATEAGQLLGADFTVLSRYGPERTHTVVGAWGNTDAPLPLPVGTRAPLWGRNAATLVFDTGQATRIEDYADSTGPATDVAHTHGVAASVGVPITVEGRLWGVMIAASRDEPLPEDTESRLAGFNELVGTAIANAQARVELRGFGEEQAALRRVATLVARAAPPEEVFAEVTAEVGRVLAADATLLSRYDLDGANTVVGGWSSDGNPLPFPVATRTPPGGRTVTSQVFETGRPVRIDDYADASGPTADMVRDWGARSSVGVPISVADRLWGAMVAASRGERLPRDTEARLTGFSELVATALANAAARAALAASRARIVAAADSTRRQIERDLHDGAQQRLVSLALHLRGTVRGSPPPESSELVTQMELVADGLTDVLDELREISRGLHPTALAEGGLGPGLKGLARRSAVPVRLDLGVDERLPEPIELAAYYVVAEALTNTAKHADASLVDVRAKSDDGMLRVRIHDDGRGGADVSLGTGLLGLADRVEALGGHLSLHSPPGVGTTMQVALPIATHQPSVKVPGQPEDPDLGPAVEPEPPGPTHGT
jgi:signal transduction histidine kinase